MNNLQTSENNLAKRISDYNISKLFNDKSMHDIHSNMTPINAVIAAQFLLSLDEIAIDKIFQQYFATCIFHLRDALDHYLSLLTRKNIALPHGKSFTQELDDSLLALKKYVGIMFHILTPKAKKILIQYLSNKKHFI